MLLLLAALASLTLLDVTAGGADQVPAYIEVVLPADAKIEIDGRPTSPPARIAFETPPITVGKEFPTR